MFWTWHQLSLDINTRTIWMKQDDLVLCNLQWHNDFPKITIMTAFDTVLRGIKKIQYDEKCNRGGGKCNRGGRECKHKNSKNLPLLLSFFICGQHRVMAAPYHGCGQLELRRVAYTFLQLYILEVLCRWLVSKMCMGWVIVSRVESLMSN